MNAADHALFEDINAMCPHHLTHSTIKASNIHYELKDALRMCVKEESVDRWMRKGMN
jgi:hypothetical protein